jgi:hypothetical protein
LSIPEEELLLQDAGTTKYQNGIRGFLVRKRTGIPRFFSGRKN